jgi:single-stranded-DNA-specific exonuclease
MNWHLLVSKKKVPKSPSELVKILLQNRGIKSEAARAAFLHSPSPDSISPATVKIDKKELKKAVARIRKAIGEKERILIYGDYDADGLCGTAILWETIYQLGGAVTPFIPDRVKDGYGINKDSLLRILEKMPDLSLIVSVDNGIVANEAIEFAGSREIDVVVIDHHLKGKSLPKAQAIVHTTALSGSGVAWFLARELSAGKLALPDLGLAALGTVADILPLLGANRSIVKYGISYLENTPRVGLRCLYKSAGIEGKPLDTYRISFVIAPRLNALGRIANPLDGLRLLCSRRSGRGEELAGLANKINVKRQKMTSDGLSLAEDLISADKIKSKLIFISSPDYHQGIIGLIAGKLSEKYHRPAIVVQEEGEICKGSARSVYGFNIISALAEFKDLFLDLGGHSMAAGFTVEKSNLLQLKKNLSSWVEKNLSDELLVSKIKVDCQLSVGQLNMDYYQAVSQLAPFGMGNPEPVFLLSGVRVVRIDQVGGDGQHLKLFLDDPATPLVERVPVEVIGFGLGEWSKKILPGDLLDIIFSLSLDTWGGRKRIVLRLKDLKIAQKVIE